MANIKRLDPGASPLHYFGAELRRLREAAELTCDQLGGIVFLTGSMIAQVETAAKIPKDEHVPRLDAALGAEGALIRAWELAQRSRLPSWYQKVAHLERTAREIRVFQAQLVHGLLQTEAYARAVLGVMRPAGEELDAKVAARLDRQRILRQDEPPVLWVVLSEAVLYQEVGGKAVMREQLAHLLSYESAWEVQIQVLPFAVGAHTGNYRLVQHLLLRGSGNGGLHGGLSRGLGDGLYEGRQGSCAPIRSAACHRPFPGGLGRVDRPCHEGALCALS